MKVPLGLLLSDASLAEGKTLIAPLEIKPQIRFPAGTVLFRKGASVIQPLEQVRQVLDKIKDRATRAKDSKLFHSAVENMDKDVTLYFGNNLELHETSVLFVNLAYCEDLAWPDGRMWKLLSTLYPIYYPEPDGKIPYSELVALLQTREVQVLNDISLLYNDSIIVEYKNILDRGKHINLREKLDRIKEPVPKDKLFDATTGGKFQISRNLFSYTKKFLYPADTDVTDEILSDPEVAALIAGDPVIDYRLVGSRQGVLLADNGLDSCERIKQWFKKHFIRFTGETLNKDQLAALLKERRPKFLLIGSLGSDKAPDVDLIRKIAEENAGTGGFDDQPLNILVLTPTKDPALEDKLRGAGLTFFFAKDEILAGDAPLDRLLSVFAMFQTPA
jgi:hypothetical protein